MADITFSFDQSGNGEVPMTLAALQTYAIDLGYAKPNVDLNKPLAARADMNAFFNAYDVKAFSMFKKKFFTEKLSPVGPGGKYVPTIKKKVKEDVKVVVVVKPEDIPSVDRYDELVAEYPSKKWRMISRPGGATMKPTDFYRLEACIAQVKEGDNETEKPMWAATGGLDFNGREAWDQWNALKGLTKDEAIAKFCLTYAEAMADPKGNFRVF